MNRLLAWYERSKRDLPWRDQGSVYGVWISEVMLQQTTVSKVTPFWQRFMARFPTVQDLAAAAEAEVLAMWSGLGYYSRARNLHASSQIIVRDLGGRFPASRAQWQTLPGIGPYASGAIASIALGEQVPALDANARRVLLRLTAVDCQAFVDCTAAQRDRMVDEVGASLVPGDRPGDWNQSLMELGASVCRARSANCPNCPVSGQCRARRGGWVAKLPPPKKRQATTAVWLAQLVVTWRGYVLLAVPGAPRLVAPEPLPRVARRKFDQLHRGLWGLPSTDWFAGGAEPDWPTAAWRDWVDDLTAGAGTVAKIRVADHFPHSITRYRLSVAVHYCELDPGREIPSAVVAGSPQDFTTGGAVSPLFFKVSGNLWPLSRLAEKGLHFQRQARD